MKLNKKLSLEFKYKKGLKTLPKNCYKNSYHNLKKLVDLYPEIKYVEGLVQIANNITIEHAWLSINNQVIELTMDLDTDYKYYPIFIYTKDELDELLPKLTPTMGDVIPTFQTKELRNQFFEKIIFGF